MLASVKMMNACTMMVLVPGVQEEREQREHDHHDEGTEPGPGHVPP